MRVLPDDFHAENLKNPENLKKMVFYQNKKKIDILNSKKKISLEKFKKQKILKIRKNSESITIIIIKCHLKSYKINEFKSIKKAGMIMSDKDGHSKFSRKFNKKLQEFDIE